MIFVLFRIVIKEKLAPQRHLVPHSSIIDSIELNPNDLTTLRTKRLKFFAKRLSTKYKQTQFGKMSTFDENGWDVDETVALISILKSLKDRNESQTIGRVDWQHVTAEMFDVTSRERDIPELRERYKKLRNDYFTARYQSVTCQYYNMLNELFQNELAVEKQVESEEDMQQTEQANEYEDDTEEQKYAHTLHLERK